MTSPLSPRDEAALDWYFGEGAALFERSTMGGMLDRAALYGSVAPPAPDDELRAAMAEWRERPWEAPPGGVTARPTAELRAQGGYAPDENLLTRYADVSRRFLAVVAKDAVAAAALAAYFGDVGARWGRTSHGRIFAVFPLTDAGRELLSRERRRQKRSSTLTPTEELGVVLDVERVQSMPARRVLIDRARVEACALFELACSLYRGK